MSYPPPKIHQLRPYLAIIVAVLFIGLLGVFGDWVNPLLRFQRESVFTGQIWRVITGHLVHLGLVHTLLNLAGMLLIVHLFGTLLTVRQWLLASLVIALGISAGFLVLNPELNYYAGLSGVLHGWLVLTIIIAIARDTRQPRWVLVLALIVVLGKLVSEQLPDYDVDYLRDYMDAAVIVDAHLYGAIIGVGLAPFYLKRQSC